MWDGLFCSVIEEGSRYGEELGRCLFERVIISEFAMLFYSFVSEMRKRFALSVTRILVDSTL